MHKSSYIYSEGFFFSFQIFTFILLGGGLLSTHYLQLDFIEFMVIFTVPFSPYLVHSLLSVFFQEKLKVFDNFSEYVQRIGFSQIIQISRVNRPLVRKEGTIFDLMDEERFKAEFKIFRERGRFNPRETVFYFVRSIYILLYTIEYLISMISGLLLAPLLFIWVRISVGKWKLIASLEVGEIIILVLETIGQIFSFLFVLLTVYFIFFRKKGYQFFYFNFPGRLVLKLMEY